MATIQDLKQKADLVANATEVGENTAERVGGALQDTADLITQLLNSSNSNASADSARDTTISNLQSALTKLQNDLQSEGTSRSSEDESLQGLITALQGRMDALTGSNASDAIDNFNEILAFLSGVKDSDTLSALLLEIKTRVGNLESAKGVAGGIATLDANAHVPVSNIPDEVKDVVMVRVWGEDVVEGNSSNLESSKFYGYNPTTKTLCVSGVDGESAYNWTKVAASTGHVYVDTTSNVPYRWDGTNMVAIAPKDSPASIFNATNEIPINGYYVLCDTDNTSISAVHAAWGAGKAVSGLILSFELSAGTWKTYQYVGKTVTEANWLNTDNWKDFGSLAAGSEPIVIIDGLPQQNKVGDYYTLETALSSLLYCQAQTGVNYEKKGLIICYGVAANKMETKQFQGELNDFSEVGLWTDFGGGGSAIETKDTPEEGGKDAFSTGGAQALLPANLKVNTDDEGVVKMQMVNADGDGLGDEVSFAVGTGSGENTGTIVSIFFKKSPMYVKAGGSVIMEAAVRSVQELPTGEVLNNIEKLELVDRDTKQVLKTLNVNKASSATVDSFDFQIDVSFYFTKAGARRFQLIAYDDSGHVGSKNNNVNAVDVTVSSVQTLNYTANTVLNVGGGAKSLQMYKFANNASDKGILAITEIYLAGEWQKLGEATVLDTYSHSVSINPSNVLGGGETLSHGAYPLRIHGEDIGSRENGVVGTGVVGNYLHTAVMVIEDGNDTPIIATRWLTDKVDGVKKLYETISVDYAVYDSQSTEPEAEVYINGASEAKRVAYRSQTYTFTKKVTDVDYDGSVTLGIVVKCGEGASQESDFLVSGTMLAIEEVKTQRQFSLDFSGRSNTESDHTIQDSGVSLDVAGVNWSTNGFVADSFGTNETDGNMALRIAENATGKLHYSPFSDAAVEQNGMAIQFTIMKKNIADDSAKLISCMKDGFGFYVDGKNVVFTFDGGKTVAHTITAALDDAERTNVAIVIEPAAIAPYSGIGVAKMYFDGEEIGACYYDAGTIVAHSEEVGFDGTLGDLYLYNVKAWRTYFGFEQEFNNYLLTMTDTDAMITEYNFNQVMASVTAENTTKNRPQAQALYNIGIPYFVLCKNKDTADNEAKDNYPEYLEGLDGDKKTKRTLDVYAYFPARPWQDFKAIGVTVTNQGTTSSARPIKNIKMKFSGATITLLHTADEFAGDDLTKYQECLANAADGKLQVLDNSLPTNIITVKVDYSESGGANNGASTNLYNDLQRELGADYVTPAQLAYNGTTKYTINSSIASIPCAFFRTDRYSPDATSPSYGYFHAKGNWNEDKGDAKVFGFEGVAGYNKDCLNYGDFYELVAAKDQTLDDYLAAQDKTKWVFYSDDKNTVMYDVVVVSEFCGPNKRIFRKQEDGSWLETTGTMSFDGSKWVVTGDVVNPVENYEMLKYDALDWFQGVNTIDDMLTIDSDGYPIWMKYFESRYPDDDNLTAIYQEGKKVPYQLYRWLRFCQDCNHHLTEANGNITVGGVSVAGTKANRLKKWKQELHTVANVHSVLCYHVFTDYIAAVDQRSKNMMVGFYLDRDGVERMYLNHLYDGDTILGSDNDGGLSIPALIDPNNDDAGVYQGHDSVLFMQDAAVGNDGFWLDDAGQSTVTMRTVAQAMRNLTTADGLVPFSYSGLVKYWITDRLSKWPKVVSSFDGERKYIEASKPTANYLYALHGLSIQRLKDFIKTRFAYRDGFYQTGDLYSSVVSMRATGTLVSIKIRAAKDGYFGIGVDRANVATDSTYLKAGDTYTLQSGMTNTGSGTMLYIFGADKLDMLDISGCTPSPSSWNISSLTLIRELIIGGANYKLQNNNEGYLTNLTLGNLPFLETLDIRKTAIATVDAQYCPRLKTVQASGSQLAKINLAEAGAIETLTVPATYKNLTLRYLPKLSNTGIVMDSPASVDTLVIEGCEEIDPWALLMKCAGASGSALKYVRVIDVNTTGDGTDLNKLKSLNLQGIDATLSVSAQPVLTGTYRLTKYTDDVTLAGWRNALPLLTVMQQLYSDYKEFDNVEDTENITNMDNATGYAYNNSYVASGHILNIRKRSVPVKGQLNKTTGKMHLTKMSESDYTKFPDGSAFDNKDSIGEQYDCFMFIPHFWYKGINDFKNQEKHTLLSSNKDMPANTYTKINQPKLSECLYADAKGVISDKVAVGGTFGDGCMGDLSSCAVYKLDVEGMKQARYIGLNNATYCAAFVDANGKILEKDVLAITGVAGSPLDFKNENGDYVYGNVPSGAKYLYFTCIRALTDDDHVILSVDSADIEAIEPGWVEHKSELIGIYGSTVDDLGLLRSISGKKTIRGNGTATTSSEWTYDAEGNPTNMPVGALNYTYQDLLNLCRYRGNGYHSISYEQSKIIAILSRCYYGNRDDQRIYGFGSNPDYTTGAQDKIGKADTVYTGSGSVTNKVWGLEAFSACMYEVMDYVAVNVTSFATWKARKRPDNDNYPIDAKWHIYDGRTKTERVVQGINSSGYCIARLKHGKYCDVIASSFSTDTSAFSTGYAAGQWYAGSKGRCVGRAFNNANAYGGLVFAHASNASSWSFASDGVRLAFDGELENESEIDSGE